MDRPDHWPLRVWIWLYEYAGMFFPVSEIIPTSSFFVQLSTQIFLVEAVPNYAASALAAHTIFSSLGGAIIPIGTFPLYDRVGYGWGNSVIAFVNLGLCAVPLTMYIVSSRLGTDWITHMEI
jgi:hypothetical protein